MNEFCRGCKNESFCNKDVSGVVSTPFCYEYEQECPICNRSISCCECLKDGALYAYNTEKIGVILEHLYLLSDVQVKHIIKLEKLWNVSYGNSVKKDVLNRLIEKRYV